jgi:transketolase
MRGIPNLWVVRPADGDETVEAWKLAMARTDGPTALCLTRQDLPHLQRAAGEGAAALRRGAYVLVDVDDPQVVLIGTGSEVQLAVGAQARLAAQGVRARVVSMPCWEAFRAQPGAERDRVLPPGLPRVSVEAGITLGWQAIVGLDGASVGIDRFGASAPGPVVAEKLGLTESAVVDAALRVLSRG